MLAMIFWIGVTAAVLMLAVLGWSIAFPARRIWPPEQSSRAQKVAVWLHAMLIFGCALILGLADWNNLGLPSWLRWCVGLPLIIAGNVVVWLGVTQIGMAATSGEATGLRTGGLYRYSRNPQYMADMVILIGWAVLSASSWTLPVVLLGMAALALAPFAEERWLADRYGEEYADYRSKVRRYI